MTQPDIYSRIFESNTTPAEVLLFKDPGEVEKSAKSLEVAAWELLLGSMQLRRTGHHTAANDWLNHATRLSIKNDVFKAELLGEAGRGLYESERLQDAFKILNSAEAIWRDVCEQAVNACAASSTGAAAEFASQLLPLFVATKTKPPMSEASIRSGKKVIPMIQQWLAERAVSGRSKTADAFIRLLAKAGQIEDARKIWGEEIEWIVGNFTTPATPLPSLAISKRLMSPSIRRALYLLLLAKGDVELAAQEFEKSAEGFAEAAAIYEDRVEDYNDINLMLRAKFNEANSLLRLHRIKEVLAIYELCEHGFYSIGETDSAQRVAHAKLFARTLELDVDES